MAAYREPTASLKSLPELFETESTRAARVAGHPTGHATARKVAMKTIALAALVMSGAFASLVAAPSAIASPASDYCQSLAGAGYPGDCATLTSLAKDVCAQYDRGLDQLTIVQRLDATTKNEGLSNYIMAGAPLYFCPKYASQN